MTRKRFIKLVMSYGKQRNEANTIAALYRLRGLPYKEAYKDYRLIYGFQSALNNLSKSARAFGDNIRKVAAAAEKMAAAINAQNHLEAGVITVDS